MSGTSECFLVSDAAFHTLPSPGAIMRPVHRRACPRCLSSYAFVYTLHHRLTPPYTPLSHGLRMQPHAVQSFRCHIRSVPSTECRPSTHLGNPEQLVATGDISEEGTSLAYCRGLEPSLPTWLAVPVSHGRCRFRPAPDTHNHVRRQDADGV